MSAEMALSMTTMGSEVAPAVQEGTGEMLDNGPSFFSFSLFGVLPQ